MSEKELNSWIDNPDSCFCDETEISKKELKSYLGHVDKMDSYFRWSYSLKQQELCALIREKAGHYFDSIVSLVPISRGVSGRINLLKIKGYTNSKPSTLDIKVSMKSEEYCILNFYIVLHLLLLQILAQTGRLINLLSKEQDGDTELDFVK